MLAYPLPPVASVADFAQAQARAVVVVSTFASDGAAVLGMTILLFRVLL